MIVLSSYRQMHNQHDDLLSSADEDNFDRAFDLIRPIIQGTADVNKKLSEDEVDQTMEFIKDIAFGDRVTPAGSSIKPSDVYNLYSTKSEQFDPPDGLLDMRGNFVSEVIHGHTVLLERGKLSMVPTTTA
jgi:hypothetical protein